jgi:signal transduction histidine kinase
VRDEGPGISEEDKEHVFDRYWRARATRNYGGLGLGLYVAKGMAEAHGGTVTLESLEGEGSTFTLDLPLGEPAAPEEGTHHVRPPDEAAPSQ